MARDAVAVQQVGADLILASITFTSMVAANDVEVTGCTPNTCLIFKNDGTSGAQAATIVSVDDQYGRSGDIAVSVAQGEVGIYGQFNGDNWYQSGTNTIHVDTAVEDNWKIAAVDFGFRL
jgi:hypothetical protein